VNAEKQYNEEQLFTKKELKRMFWTAQFAQVSTNYERLQNVGFLYAILPFLRKKYKNASKEEKTAAMKRHLEFFNTHHVPIHAILGTSMALEEKTAADQKEAVTSLKVSLMGPLAGLGDSLLSYTWLAICGSIGASLAMNGSIIGPILMLLMVNAVWMPLKYYGLLLGYQKGVSFLSDSKSQKIIQRFSDAANVMGTIVISSLVVSVVKMKLGLEFNLGEDNVLVIQDLINKIMPNILPVLLTVFCYFFLKKTNGKYVVPLIMGLLVVGTLLSMAGVLS
jgi:mannose PTS system EIID component